MKFNRRLCEWIVLVALLPIAFPIVIGGAMIVLTSSSDALVRFLLGGDLFLAAVILTIGVLYDASDALTNGHAERDQIWVPRLFLGALAFICLVFYLCLKALSESDQTKIHQSPNILWGEVLAFAVAVILSALIRYKTQSR